MLPFRKDTSPEDKEPLEREAEIAARSVERALGHVSSQEEAERVLEDLERSHASETLGEIEDALSGPGTTAPEKVERVTSGRRGEERPAAALEAVIEATAKEEEGAEELAQAVQEQLARPPTDYLKPHRYLRRAVLNRMTPLQAWDASLFIAVNRLPHPRPAVRFMVGVSTVTWHGAGWVVAVLALAAVDGRRGRRAALELIPILLATNALVEQLIKKYIRRRRPFITIVRALVVGRKPGSWSFPSGHSANSWACACAMASCYRRPRPLFYFLASLVSFSRVYLGHHYPTDVLSGGTIGVVISRAGAWAVRRYVARRSR